MRPFTTSRSSPFFSLIDLTMHKYQVHDNIKKTCTTSENHQVKDFQWLRRVKQEQEKKKKKEKK